MPIHHSRFLVFVLAGKTKMRFWIFDWRWQNPRLLKAFWGIPV